MFPMFSRESFCSKSSKWILACSYSFGGSSPAWVLFTFCREIKFVRFFVIYGSSLSHALSFACCAVLIKRNEFVQGFVIPGLSSKAASWNLSHGFIKVRRLLRDWGTEQIKILIFPYGLSWMFELLISTPINFPKFKRILAIILAKTTSCFLLDEACLPCMIKLIPCALELERFQNLNRSLSVTVV